MVQTINPFIFCTERRLVELTGLRAGNLREFLAHLRSVEGSSIFHHTHHHFLAHHLIQPEFHNDFAAWIYDHLQEEALGEQLAAIDLFEFTTIRRLREAFITTVEGYLKIRRPPPGKLRPAKTFTFVNPRASSCRQTQWLIM